MRVKSTTEAPRTTGADTIVVGVFENEEIAHDLEGRPLSALLQSGEAGRERGRIAVTHVDGRRHLLVGLGARAAFDGERARVAAGLATGRARELRARSICWEVPHHVGDDVVGGLIEGTLLRDYRFDRYRPGAVSGGGGPRLDELILSAHHELGDVVEVTATITAAQNRARDLGNTPSNELTPTDLAEYAVARADAVDGLEASWLGEEAIREEGMGAFAAVAQGSSEDARLIRLSYTGSGASGQTLALVGKAVTFDTGGIWLKPSAKMNEMKFDMAGGAAVIEAVATLAQLQAPVRVIGIVGATENMLSGRAVKPGDVVTALDGTTIEINNTDAEGRLVLADCITFARREGAERIVDIATLTGGVVAALGSVHAGLMSNDDDLAGRIEACGRASGDLVWRLPLHERYAEMVRGRVAQLTNLSERREAMALTAAHLLGHFAGDVPWAHIDIAGTGWDAKTPYIADAGATGYGVRLLVALARNLAA